MRNRITIITGKRGVGKTTSLRSIISDLSDLGFKIKGFNTFFKRECLVLEWLNINQESVIMAKKNSPFSMIPNLDSLKHIGQVLEAEEFYHSVFCADEIGFLESLSKEMQEGIIHSISSSMAAVITLRKGRYPFLKKIKEMKAVKLYDLDDYSVKERENIKKEILEKLRG